RFAVAAPDRAPLFRPGRRVSIQAGTPPPHPLRFTGMTAAYAALAAVLLAQPVDPLEQAGWLWPGCPTSGCACRVPYCPHEGDVVFMTDAILVQSFTFWLAGTGHPQHMGLIVRRPDGSLAILESGGMRRYVTIRPICERLMEHRLHSKNS